MSFVAIGLLILSGVLGRYLGLRYRDSFKEKEVDTTRRRHTLETLVDHFDLRLNRIERMLKTMAVSQDELEVDIQALITAVTALIANPKIVDLSKQDAEIKGLLSQVQAASGTTPA